ncbi:MAG: hypothetical protein NTW07_08185 [candidate division Zixibacteria bacterium]|nr:hypothetical protein [candidate division Zixibacteria bacterium]
MGLRNALGICGVLVITFAVEDTLARGNFDKIIAPPSSATSPAYCIAEHNVGRMALAVTNMGTFGTGFSQSGNNDFFTGDQVQSCEYPKSSRSNYLFAAAVWIGAVLGRDTLVSVGADGWQYIREFNPDQGRVGEMRFRSNIDPSKKEFEGAISEQDYISVYCDTCVNCAGVGNDVIDRRGHQPLNLEITERSFAWSYAYAQDFVLFDYGIRNIGQDRLRRVYMGVYVDADIWSQALGEGGAQDDLCGFREKQPALYMKPPCPQDSDVVNIAWTVDNDGDLGRPGMSVPNVTATRIVRTPSDSLEVSFNWWVSNQSAALDFGPQTRRGYRDFGTGGSGTPEGDRNKFYILSNKEFDYDQPRAATISALDTLWLPPPADRAIVWATGLDTRYVLSFGPFEIEPGQTLPISLAYVAGMNFHQTLANFDNLPYDPNSWYEGVNFDSLGSNATWADWVYDNPGVDTDSDGYFGEYTLCNFGDDSTWTCDTSLDTTADPDTNVVTCLWEYDQVDTIWRKGDGVPDFRGATPPPSPATYTYRGQRGMRAEPGIGSIRLIWNGVLSENTPDVFSRKYDFEGYRVWIGRDERSSSYNLLASYDIEDYIRLEYNSITEAWELKTSPFTLAQLRCLYADSCTDALWFPGNYTRYRPLVVPGVNPGDDPFVCYFEPQDYNRYILANDPVNANTPIRKVYPNAPKPPMLNPDSIKVYFPDGRDTLYLTKEGFVKYYEYELTLEDLLPTIPYWINVTAFDYGSPESGLESLETSPTMMPLITYALPSTEKVAADQLDVFVYPNPYRLDENYRERGFEARGEMQKDVDRTRRIHFANLPSKCTIRIFSLDGDLVREITHDIDRADPLSNHDTWDLITRNFQQAVSGLYYWTVEDESGRTQIGKLAIIL